MAGRLGFSLVVAAEKNRGIGYKGKLPWKRLKTDLDSMFRITVNTKNKDKQNAVIMGRKTWQSIPKRIVPLKDRFNVVLSKTLTHDDLPEAHMVASSLESAMQQLESPPLSDKIEYVYILGGEPLYEESLQSPRCDKIYYTDIMAEFPVDTFMPPIDMTKYRIVEDSDEVPQGVIEENGTKYKFIVYERI